MLAPPPYLEFYVNNFRVTGEEQRTFNHLLLPIDRIALPFADGRPYTGLVAKLRCLA